MKTLSELAKEALLSSNASNLTGVLITFSRAMSDLRDILAMEEDFSTEKLNSHPVAVVWSQTVANLTGSEYGGTFSEAYNWCRDLTDAARPVITTFPAPIKAGPDTVRSSR